MVGLVEMFMLVQLQINEIVLFTDGDINIEVQINPEQETVWLTQKQMEV